MNNPYPKQQSKEKIYYSSFAEQPKTLDPARSYTVEEALFTTQIYEPLLQYDYWERPFKLIPLTAAEMPTVKYYNNQGQLIHGQTQEEISKTVYTIHLKSGILYQPHPAFAKDQHGHLIYLNLPNDYLRQHHITALNDFKVNGTRELTVDDYIYQIKRLASPHVNSPIYGLMSAHILGFKEFAQKLPRQKQGYIDLRQYPLAGLNKIDNYTFEIMLKGQFQQFPFWLSMPFFSPIPWEVDQFYAQSEMKKKNLNFSWYPVGTGPFMLIENNPNRQMVLGKNPNYHVQYFPEVPGQPKTGYLKHAGERLPLIDKAIYTLEKEAIPRWTKFLQGYYDLSGISTDSFDQAIRFSSTGEATLSPYLQKKNIRLQRSMEPSIYYLGFNMLDPIIGGASERARKLRQAISIVVNYDEYISIFYNGRGRVAQSPLPAGIFGHKTGKSGINPYVYQWDGYSMKRRSVKDAKALMHAAGYPNGRDPKTGRPLILHYDVPSTGGPDDKAEMDWMRKQFAKLGIALDIRATQYNHFQEKIRTGNMQIFKLGWNADYPDPENVLFLFYGPNAKVKQSGENATNYQNAQFDALFDLMKNRKNDAERLALLDKMVAILRHDAPWVWGINTELFTLSHQWVDPPKPNPMWLGTLKYVYIDVEKREALQHRWNQAIFWPVGLLILACCLGLIPIILGYWNKQRAQAKRMNL